MTTQVTRREVIDHWLTVEGYDPAAMDTTERLAALLERKPGAAAFLWREQPVDWVLTRIEWDSFRQLRPIRGPDQLHWRRLSTDGTVLGGARRLQTDAHPPVDGIDRETIDRYRDHVAAGRTIPPLIVRTVRGATPWYVVDGNHRATALAWHAVETGEYEPQPAYVAVTGRTAFQSGLDRLRGLFQRLRGYRIGRP